MSPQPQHDPSKNHWTFYQYLPQIQQDQKSDDPLSCAVVLQMSVWMDMFAYVTINDDSDFWDSKFGDLNYNSFFLFWVTGSHCFCAFKDSPDSLLGREGA